MGPAATSADSDAGFTLDAALLEQRRAERARRVNTVLVPLFRTIGFVILCAMVMLQHVRADVPVPRDPLLSLLAANIAYCVLSWLVLRFAHGRTGRIDLSLVMLHADVLMWLLNLRFLEQSHLFFAYLLLVRVADQVGWGFRRAYYFNHVIVLAYLGYSVLVSTMDPAQARWVDRLTIAVVMYLVGSYLAVTGSVNERLRNRMRQAVRTARSLVESLEQKTRALQEQADELDLARRQAEQASLAKSQFLAVISHEIRTPMNGVLGTTELLLNSPLTPQQRRLAEISHRSGTALLALIDDVLDLSRIEAGRLTLHPSSVDLRALITDAVDLMAATARDKPVTLHSHIPPTIPQRIEADPTRLRQLLVNLLHNAVKFTERGRVELMLSIVEDRGEPLRLRFEVSDTGIGIPPDQLDAVFQAFTQADASSTRRHGGSGLGLAIVKDLAQLMGGDVGVQSRLGEGSTFWFEMDTQRTLDTTERAEPLPDGGETQSVRVLLAEDDAVNQMVVEQMLSRLGCVVDVVSNGAAASAVAAGTHYDLVFMDLQMPEMDGFEAAHRIRLNEQPRGRRTPIVALTANALSDDRERCLASGMDDYMTKPVSSAMLAAAIERWAGRRTPAPSQW